MEKIKSIVATIVLGALGSAFWEVCLKDIFSSFVNKLIPYLMQCFNDSFYSRVSRGLNTTSFNSFSYIMILFVIMITFPCDFFTRIFHSNQKDPQKRILQNILYLSCFFAIMYNFFVVALVSNTARDTINNIEIVAPYITDMEYKQLRADFFQMDSKSDYQSLVEKLESIAESHGLQLK